MGDQVPPSVILHQLLCGHWISQALCVAAELGVADRLESGPRDVADLAHEVSAHPGALFRLMRALASVGVFSEVAPRSFALTPVGDCLRSTAATSLRALARTVGAMDWAAWSELHHSVRTGETAFRRVHGVTPFEHFRAHPEVGRLFDEAMSGFVTQNGVAVAEAYDFGSLSRIVDVGGGDGTLAISILRAHAGIRAVVFDLPDVIATTRKRVESAGLTARCEFVAGSFFESIPAGADAYLLASIIHDWEEERCWEILARCREAAPPHAKLLLLEMVIPPGDDPFFGKLLDLEMLACFGGRERSAPEYRELLAGAGFELTRIVATRTPTSVIEAVPR